MSAASEWTGSPNFRYSADKQATVCRSFSALVVTPEDSPLGCGVLSGNTADSTTLPAMLQQIESQYARPSGRG
jgi:transposase